MKRLFAGAAIAAFTLSPVYAQAQEDLNKTVADVPVSTSPSEIVPSPEGLKSLLLRNGTPINLAVPSEVNSSTHEAGDVFQLTVLDDVRIGDMVVIPSGTPASAEITWRTGKGAFGKSGKFEFSLRSIDLDGQKNTHSR